MQNCTIVLSIGVEFILIIEPPTGPVSTDTGDVVEACCYGVKTGEWILMRICIVESISCY